MTYGNYQLDTVCRL